MKDANKKWLTIAAGLTLSGALLMMITSQFDPAKQTDGAIGSEGSEGNQLVVTNPEDNKDPDNQTDSDTGLKIPSISGGDSSENTTSPPILLTDADGNILETHPDPSITIPLPDSMNGTDTGTSQTIQPNVKPKPNYTESQLKDPTKTPDGGKVTVTEDGKIEPEEVPEPTPAPTPTPEPTPIPPIEATKPSGSGTNTTTPSTSTPSTGSTNSNKTQSDANGAYVPGFGYVPYNNTPNVGTQATDMYENGNKVGNM